MIGFGSFFRQLARDLWSQKLRTFLTTFGIIWGTVAVSLLLAFGNGLHRQMIKSVAGLGDRIVIAWPMRTSMTFEGLGKGRRMRMMEEDIDFLEAQVPLIAGISSEYSQSLIARYGDRQRSVDVSGVSPSYGVMRNMIPAVAAASSTPSTSRSAAAWSSSATNWPTICSGPRTRSARR